jgi:hypothetical protein
MIQLLIAIDFRFGNGKLIGREERIESIPDHTMFASWYATTQPQGYRSVCGGLVYVRDSDIFRIEISDDKSPIEVDEGYVWSDTNPDGVMFAIVLPVDHSLADPIPLPYEAKNFQGRVAVHWRIPPPEGPKFEVSWRLRELSEDIDLEVKRINKVIFDARRGGETPKYDVALSYASEDKEYVDELATALKQMGVTYFYDRDEDQAVNLWGRNLYQYLAEVYSKARPIYRHIHFGVLRKEAMDKPRATKRSGPCVC